MKIYTIGYSGRTVDELERIVTSNDGALLDIRYSTRSRNPDYSKKRLVERFTESYVHVYEFGNINYNQPGAEIELYAPGEGIEMIGRFNEKWSGAIFLMCACRDGHTCHRRIVGDLLREHGYDVEEYHD